jgi:hypothetical protein
MSRGATSAAREAAFSAALLQLYCSDTILVSLLALLQEQGQQARRAMPRSVQLCCIFTAALLQLLQLYCSFLVASLQI